MHPVMRRILLGGNKLLISDGFTRADNAASMGNADTGQAWTVLAGTWGISGNTAYASAGAGDNYTVVDSLGPNVKITTMAVFNYFLGMIFRMQDANNYLQFRCLGNALAFYKRVGGSFTTLATCAFNYPAGSVVVFGIKAKNSTITILLNNVPVIVYSISDFNTATKHGILTHGAAGTDRFYNFKVVAI